MKIDFSYMEVAAKPSVTKFESTDLKKLEEAMFRTQILTFGWAIAPVIYNDLYKPHAIKGGIECRIQAEHHHDYWTLMRTGEFYFIGELFENGRNPAYIFIDTRTNRITETFLRVGALYEALGVPSKEMIQMFIKHGNIRGKTLGAGSSARFFPVARKSSVDEVKTDFSLRLKDMTDLPSLKDNVHRAVRDLGEMFEMFNPDKHAFTDPIVEAFKAGKVI